MKREPIFGENAKAFFIQAAVAIAVGVTLKMILGDWFLAWIRQGVDYVMG